LRKAKYALGDAKNAAGYMLKISESGRKGAEIYAKNKRRAIVIKACLKGGKHGF